VSPRLYRIIIISIDRLRARQRLPANHVSTRTRYLFRPFFVGYIAVRRSPPALHGVPTDRFLDEKYFAVCLLQESVECLCIVKRYHCFGCSATRILLIFVRLSPSDTFKRNRTIAVVLDFACCRGRTAAAAVIYYTCL